MNPWHVYGYKCFKECVTYALCMDDILKKYVTYIISQCHRNEGCFKEYVTFMMNQWHRHSWCLKENVQI